MQEKSDQYRAALYESYVIQSSVSGRIILTDGSVIEITDKDIIPGTLTINNKCVNNSSFEFGAVYQGELSVQIKNDVDRYKIKDAKIEFTEHRNTTDGIEDVYLGAFYVTEPSRSKALLNIKSLDKMDNFDTEVEDTIIGKPYDLLSLVCDKCNVALEQTEEYFAGLPNGETILWVYADTVDTYRDMIAYIGMITGTFGTIVADKLRMATFMTDVVLEIPAGKRNNTVIEDYQTYYRGIRARFIADSNYYPYTYVDEESTDGLILDIGDIPIVRGDENEKKAVLSNLYKVLKNIKYTPVSFTLLTSDGALELGDRIKIDTVETYITSFTYVYHGSESIKGVGDNPRLKANDKISKQLSDLEASVSAKDVIVHSYTNAKEINLGENEKQIISINYAAVADSRPIFIATVPFTLDKDGVIVFKYYLDNVLMTDDTVMQYLPRGEHFVTISNNFIIDKDKRNTLTVKACTEYFESDVRMHDAKIISFENYINTGTYTKQEIDTAVPQATITKGSIRAALYAQGIAGSGRWDGTINFSDIIPDYIITGRKPVTVESVSESLNINTQIPTTGTASDTVGDIAVSRGTIEIIGYSIAMNIEESE